MEGETWARVKPYIAIVALQFGYSGMYIIGMLTLKHGMSHYILVTYRHLVATIVIAPFVFFQRKIHPKITFSIFLKIFALGLLEPVIDQNLYFLGMKYTSASFTSAFTNLIPAITFILALIFRLEKIEIKKRSSQAKFIGTMVTVCGAMVMTIYKGTVVGQSGSRRHDDTSAATAHHWLAGTIMLFVSTISWSGFFILQSFTLRTYPSEVSLTWLICLVGMIQSGAVALVMERRREAWAVGWDSRLLASVYTGVICSGMAYYVQGMINRTRGPVFITAFSPLGTIITTTLGCLFLAEQLHLGSIIGAAIIVCGLYSVVWGKNKDLSLTEELPIRNPNTCEKTVTPKATLNHEV